MRDSLVLKHKFVEFIPREVEVHTIYISITYATAIHNCACGCGNRVVTPLSPAEWRLIFDGRTISFEPSIGNWSFSCRSHYWIRNNRVIWSGDWSDDDVAEGRKRDARAIVSFYGKSADKTNAPSSTKEQRLKKKKGGLKSKIKKWFGGGNSPNS